MAEPPINSARAPPFDSLVIDALGHARRGMVAATDKLAGAASETAHASVEATRSVTDRVTLSEEASLIGATVDRVEAGASFSANARVAETAAEMLDELTRER